MAIIILMALILCLVASVWLLCLAGWLFVTLLPLLYVAFCVWMLVNCLTKRDLTGNEKIAWSLVILFIHPVGAFIYFFAGRPKRYAAPPVFAI
jgi:hypothetical protein